MVTKVIGIKSAYSSDVIEIPFSDKTSVVEGDEVIFKDKDDREEYGVVKYVDREAVEADDVVFTSKILRKATANDIQRVDGNIDKAKSAMVKCNSIIKDLKLDMSVFRTGYSFDGSSVHFMFTSEDRVDFRELVKLLAKTLKKQIHLKQIGPRDKARMISGYGKCGRSLCCSTWLGKLESINMEMVRIQGLENKGSSKLSGTCGKLLCCLKYEVDAYKSLRKGLPRAGSIVSVKKNCELKAKERVKVFAVDILNQKIKVATESGDVYTLNASDVEDLKLKN